MDQEIKKLKEAILRDDESQDYAYKNDNRPLLSEGMLLNEDSCSQKQVEETPKPATKVSEPKTRKNIGHYSIGKG